MTLPDFMLAQLEGLNPLDRSMTPSKSSGMVFRDILLIIGTGLVLAAILFAWAKFYVARKQRRRNHESRPVRNRMEDDFESEEGGQHRRRRRRRRHRRDHRPRSPTLAETGGLPPAKPNLSPPDSP